MYLWFRSLPIPSQLSEHAIGVAAVSLEALLSGLSNVYFERVLKSTSLTLWERNVQLAGYSLLIYVPMAMHAHPGEILHGWSSLTVLVAFLGALGGILIGLVLKFCDSVIKNPNPPDPPDPPDPLTPLTRP